MYLTPQHHNILTPQHHNILTPQHPNTLTPQHLLPPSQGTRKLSTRHSTTGAHDPDHDASASASASGGVVFHECVADCEIRPAMLTVAHTLQVAACFSLAYPILAKPSLS